MLAALLAGQPSRHWHLPIPLLLSPETSSTFQPPLGPVMHSLTSNFAEANGDHASLFCVQPWLDFTPVTSSLTITQFGEERDVTELMKTLASKLWKIRDSFVIDWVSPTDLLSKIETIPERPVLVSEAPDSPTGGASGDHTGLLTCLLPRAQELRSCIYLVDAQFAERAHSAGIGTAVDGYIGAGIDRRFSQPRYIKGRVEHLSDGVFTAKGPAFHGRPFSMGPTAVLAVSNLRIVVASKPVMMIDPELYRSQGIEPGAQDVVGIKSSLLFRPAYEPISRTVLHLDMPGPCRGRLDKVAYKHINRPIYPLDNFDWIPPAPEKFTPV
jgi:microcystin degradation protein MlrC